MAPCPRLFPLCSQTDSFSAPALAIPRVLLAEEAACQGCGSERTSGGASLKKVGNMDLRKVVLASVVFLLAASSAWAGDRENKARAAQKACLLGDAKKGIEILADLYLDSNDATYIYNQGRCLEQNGQNEPAILRFQEYLRKETSLSPADADAVRKRIRDLQAAIEHRGKPAPAEPVATPTPAPAATTPSPQAPPVIPTTAPTLAMPTEAPPPQATPVGSTIPASAAVAPTPEPLGITQPGPKPELQESQPVYKRWWFWTGVGAVVAGGVVAAVMLSSKSAAKSPSCDQGATCVQ